jgi:DNA-binding response OmpR family regulator
MEAGPVLVIEADDDLRGAVTELLVDHGYAVRAVATRQEALALVADATVPAPAVILLDAWLTDVSTEEFVRVVRAGARTTATAILLTSDPSGPAPVHVGVDACLLKPFRLKRFLFLVDALVRGTRRLRR